MFELVENINHTDIVPIAKAIGRATEITLGTILGEEPKLKGSEEKLSESVEIAGIMSFVGTANATFAMLMNRQTATNLVYKMLGFEIDFDSSDMNDGVGELVNVIAGEIVAQIELIGYQTAMSLPMVIRAKDVSIMPKSTVPMITYDYSSNEGEFRIEVVSQLGNELMLRKPGQ